MTLLAISPAEGILCPPPSDAASAQVFPQRRVCREEGGQVPAMEALAGESPARFRFRLVLHIVLGYALFLSAVFAALVLSLMAIFAALAARYLAGRLGTRIVR
jgi:hypothetical protein